MKKFSQKQIAFLILYYNRGRWLFPFDLIGNLNVSGKDYFGSYKMPARLSDLFYDLNGILERKKVKGREKAVEYFTYRMKRTFDKSKLPDYYRKLL